MDGLSINYTFVAGDDWQVAGGTKTGAGQHSFKSVVSDKQRLVWSMPFEIIYRSMTPYGWPQIVLECRSRDNDGDAYVRAYGCAHVPIKPGRHTKQVRMFTPLAKDKCAEFFGLFHSSSGMVIDEPEMIAKALGREVGRVNGDGKVTITINVTERNMVKHGYVNTTNKK